jgi:hypothetical protein
MQQQGELTWRMNELSADQAEIDAYNAELDGYTMASRYQTTIDSIIGSQTAMQSARGVDTEFGTAEIIKEESKLNAFLNLQDIRNEAHSRAMGYKRESRNIRAQGMIQQADTAYRISETKRQGFIGAGMTAASGYAKSGGFDSTETVDGSYNSVATVDRPTQDGSYLMPWTGE